MEMKKQLNVDVTKDDLKNEFMKNLTQHSLWIMLSYYLDEESEMSSDDLSYACDELYDTFSDWIVATISLVGKETTREWKDELIERLKKDVTNGNFLVEELTCTCEDCKEHFIENVINETYDLGIQRLADLINDEWSEEDLANVGYTSAFFIHLHLVD